jgi:hypothetical protein
MPKEKKRVRFEENERKQEENFINGRRRRI